MQFGSVQLENKDVSGKSQESSSAEAAVSHLHYVQ